MQIYIYIYIYTAKFFNTFLNKYFTYKGKKLPFYYKFSA